MPDVDDILPVGGTYLKGDELVGCDDLELTVAGVEVKEYEDGKAILVSFNEIEQKFRISNQVNKEMMVEVTGSKNTDNWIGKSVTLYGTTDMYGGKKYNVVRVRPPAPKKTGKAFAGKRQQQYSEINPPPADDMSDEVPF